jgi:hypothetical protein
MAQSFIAFVDPAYDFNTRLQIGKDIVRYIQDRTTEGLGIGRRPFGKYSNAYQETREFEIAKQGETKVNLTLSGDMLSSVSVLDASIPGRIEIGIDGGFEEDKARFMKEKGYEFLGLSSDELDSIVSEYETQTPEQREARNEIS